MSPGIVQQGNLIGLTLNLWHAFLFRLCSLHWEGDIQLLLSHLHKKLTFSLWPIIEYSVLTFGWPHAGGVTVASHDNSGIVQFHILQVLETLLANVVEAIGASWPRENYGIQRIKISYECHLCLSMRLHTMWHNCRDVILCAALWKICISIVYTNPNAEKLKTPAAGNESMSRITWWLHRQLLYESQVETRLLQDPVLVNCRPGKMTDQHVARFGHTAVLLHFCPE